MPASPPTERVVDVLELVAEATEPVRLAEVVRSLGITQGTAHAILDTLCARGWLTRDQRDRRFAVGPIFDLIGAQASSESLRVRAGRAAVDLADALGCAVSVTARFGDVLVITALEGDIANHDLAVGDRMPYAAPLGLAFAAWEPPELRRAWLGPGAPRHAKRLDAVLLATRARGFSVERMTRTLPQTVRLIAALREDPETGPLQRAIDALLTEITSVSLVPDDVRDPSPVVTSIAAPILDSSGHAVANIAVHPFRDLSSRQIESIGRRLTRAAAASSQSPPLHGGHE